MHRISIDQASFGLSIDEASFGLSIDQASLSLSIDEAVLGSMHRISIDQALTPARGQRKEHSSDKAKSTARTK
jgi:hypothetical protein